MISVALPTTRPLLPACMLKVTAAHYHSLRLLPLLTGRWMPCFAERDTQGIPSFDYVPGGQGLSGILKEC